MNTKVLGFVGAVALSSGIALNATPGMAALITVTDSTDLDFKGDFKYAINFNGSGSQTVGDAVFTNVRRNGLGSPEGFTIEGFTNNSVWSTGINLGSNTGDDATLANIMRSIVWSRQGPGSGHLDLAVAKDTKYRLQLLFSEGFNNNRFVDVKVENGSFSNTKRAIGTALGGQVERSTTQGYAMTWDFTATDSNLSIDMLRPINPEADTNYIVSGLTLENLGSTEPVPEPLTILGTVAALGMGTAMKRKFSADTEA